MRCCQKLKNTPFTKTKEHNLKKVTKNVCFERKINTFRQQKKLLSSFFNLLSSWQVFFSKGYKTSLTDRQLRQQKSINNLFLSLVVFVIPISSCKTIIFYTSNLKKMLTHTFVTYSSNTFYICLF